MVVKLARTCGRQPRPLLAPIRRPSDVTAAWAVVVEAPLWLAYAKHLVALYDWPLGDN